MYDVPIKNYLNADSSPVGFLEFFTYKKNILVVEVESYSYAIVVHT